MFYLPFETDVLCTNSENRMNGREVFIQTSAKQTNAQTQASTTYAKSKNYNFDPMQLCLFSVANTFIVFMFKILCFTFLVLPYMVMWREI